MRYFLITYNYNKDNINGTVAQLICSENFPNHKRIIDTAEDDLLLSKNINHPNIIIINIFEFKNKKDYNNFIK